MPYNWITKGEGNPHTIALIAPSSAPKDSLEIKNRIDLLVDLGFCVHFPQYDDETILVEPDVENRQDSDRMKDAITPAISKDTCVQQIIECIKNRWNIMPFMGGDSFEAKIPDIINHFTQHPEEKDPRVLFFGLSNATYATILASHGICTFISTAFTSILKISSIIDTAIKTQLIQIMQGIETAPYGREILSDPENALANLRFTHHYPVNFGNVITEIIQDAENPDHLLALNITNDLNWSLGFEGFIQRPGNVNIINYPYFLDKFLAKHRENKPQFIEVGHIVTRLDGKNGYANLLYDESRHIIINQDNIDIVNAPKLKQDIQKVNQTAISLRAKSDLTSFEVRQLEIMSLIPREIFTKAETDQDFNQDDIVQIITAQNIAQDLILSDIISVASKYNVPVISNTRNGHCANMSIVGGGLNRVNVVDDKVELDMTLLRDQSRQASNSHTSGITR